MLESARVSVIRLSLRNFPTTNSLIPSFRSKTSLAFAHISLPSSVFVRHASTATGNCDGHSSRGDPPVRVIRREQSLSHTSRTHLARANKFLHSRALSSFCWFVYFEAVAQIQVLGAQCHERAEHPVGDQPHAATSKARFSIWKCPGRRPFKRS